MKNFGLGSCAAVLVGVLFSLTASDAGANSGACLPFFDFSKDTVVSNVVRNGSLQRGAVDITPEPMATNALSDMVLRACGAFGSRVNPKDVRSVVQNLSPDLVKQLNREFSQFSDSQLRELLAKIWSQTNGFEHIFCGQPNSKNVGGLHYGPRYFELQKKGELCRLDNNILSEEVLPQNVYTIGVATDNGTVDRKKGFSIRQSAEDIFFEASRAYLRNCNSQSKNRRVCISRFHQDNSFGSLFVCSPGSGIITFYPLAAARRDQPDCR